MSSIDPIRIPVTLAGFFFEWFVTRRWRQVLMGAIPVLIFCLLALGVYFGGQMDRNALADRYLKLGAPLVEPWEEKLFENISKPADRTKGKDSQPQADAAGTVDGATPNETNDNTDGDENRVNGAPKSSSESVGPAESTELNSSQLSTADDTNGKSNDEAESPTSKSENDSGLILDSYGEMLYKRAELLRESPETKFVIGTNMLMRGLLQPGQHMLRKISPDDAKGDPKGHAVLAYSYLTQFGAKKDPALLNAGMHHADLAVDCPNTPKDILLFAADMQMRKQNPDRAFEIFQVAADRYPELLPALYQRSLMVGKKDLAETSRQKALSNLQSKLDADAKDDVARIQLVGLLGVDDKALEKAEKLLNEGLALGPSEKLTRTLSEIYRVRFVKFVDSKKGKVDDFSLLDKALEIDPANPMVAEQVARMVRDGIRPSKELRKALEDSLSSGNATVQTHAWLSEYYLAANKRTEAIKQLEKVFERAPEYIKYSNNLAYLYAAEGRLEDAQKTATRCLAVVQSKNATNQKFVDEILDTLGMIYQKQEKTNDAISSYELALRFNPDRIDTRTRLAEIYDKMGIADVAKAQRDFIETIKQKLKDSGQPVPPSKPSSLPEKQTEPQNSPTKEEQGKTPDAANEASSQTEPDPSPTPNSEPPAAEASED